MDEHSLMEENLDDPGRRLDGNAAAGVLSELLAVEPTTAVATCAHCGDRAALGRLMVYADAPALVLRCPSCMEVVLRAASDRAGLRLEMSGVRLLTVAPEQVARNPLRG